MTGKKYNFTVFGRHCGYAGMEGQKFLSLQKIEKIFCRVRKKNDSSCTGQNESFNKNLIVCMMHTTKSYLRISAIEARTTSFAYIGLWTPLLPSWISII